MNKFVVLSSNYTEIAGVSAEHGLSLAIFTNGKKIVFDTGQSNLFFKNSQMIGIDIQNPDAVVISHNHYDHTGGLGSGIYADVLFYPEDFGKDCFRKLKNGSKSINSPFLKSFLDSVAKKHVCVKETCDTDFGKIIITSSVTEFYEDSAFTKQYFMNELSLVVAKTLFVGCSHTGLFKIIETALSSGLKIESVVGGFHTKNMSDEAIHSIAEKLKDYKIKRVYPFHCSGFALNEKLKNMGIISIYPSTGNSFDIC